ncbi:hypothetical protein KA025_02635 [Candidatus Saccharibacteria bacterium]|nr:hypothetical protein [Candidatus Saccharibacteria bacterium]MBP7834961.1 hypothetical protein [Candidatus Saccharibacteria bacterium]
MSNYYNERPYGLSRDEVEMLKQYRYEQNREKVYHDHKGTIAYCIDCADSEEISPGGCTDRLSYYLTTNQAEYFRNNPEEWKKFMRKQQYEYLKKEFEQE